MPRSCSTGSARRANQVQGDSSFIETLSPALAHPFKQGFAESMDLVFLLGAGVGLVAFLLLLLMPKVELRAHFCRGCRAGPGGRCAVRAPQSGD